MTVRLQMVDLESIAVPSPTPLGASVDAAADAIVAAGGLAAVLAVEETAFDSYRLLDPGQQAVLFFAARRAYERRPPLCEQVYVALGESRDVLPIRAQLTAQAAAPGMIDGTVSSSDDRMPRESNATARDDDLDVRITRALRRTLAIPGPEHPQMIDPVAFFNGDETQAARLLSEVYPAGAAIKARRRGNTGGFSSVSRRGGRPQRGV